MPDQERRVAKVNIGADFTLLRYCEYLPWLAGAGEGEVSPLVPLCQSCGRIANVTPEHEAGTVSSRA